ncbi:MAG TPA: O-antigen ligase family protein, partial [Pyrinomonadaceae bacterium]|nr:O-antigen ligase family protein [Pyrinomonadaceae bacterium]
MTSRFENLMREPRWIIGAMWPLVLLTPHLPGLPRPAVGGLPWRQELGLSLLLSITLGLFLIRRDRTKGRLGTDRKDLTSLAFAGLFVVWIWFSVTWATDHYQALHLALQWSSYLIFFAIIMSAPRKVIRSSFITLAIVVWTLAFACAIESWFGAFLTDVDLRIGVKPLLRGSGGFGEIMGATCILFAAYALDVNRRRVAFICGATAVAGWLATLQSLERAPLLATTVGLLLLFTVVFINPSKRMFLRLGTLIAAFAFVFLLQSGPLRLTSHDPTTLSRLQQSLANDGNSQARFLLWGAGLEMLRTHPL